MSTTAVLPTQPEERLATLDVLRAFALLGILVVNMWDFAYTASFRPSHERWPAWWDQAADWIVMALFAGKFNSLFSFLFGVGFFLQLQRLSAAGSSGIVVYLRRLAVLFVLGVLHAVFIWWGDVLHIYAVLGVVLLVMRNWSNKAVWAVLLLSLLLPTAVSTYRYATVTPEEMARLRTEAGTRIEQNNHSIIHGTYWDATRERVEMQQFIYGEPRTVLTAYATFLTTVLLGFWTARAGYVRRAAERKAFLKKAMFWCLVIGLGCGAAMAVGFRYVVPFQISPLGMFLTTMYSFGRPTLMLAYAIALVLLIDAGWWPRFFHWLTFVGRMPLTNYLMQSVICTLLFYGYGFGAIDTLKPAAVFALSFAIWGLQIPLSVFWFRHFRFGPMEWLWRTATYGAVRAARPQPIAASAID
jgi:uncharacterized protein